MKNTFALLLMASLTQACTAGYITNADGSEWNPAPGTHTITFVNESTNAQYTTNINFGTQRAGYATFSFDPNGPNNASNSSVSLPNGTYRVVIDDAFSDAFTVNNLVACPSGTTDFYTNKPTDCQLFHFIYQCGWIAPPPSQNGDFTVVTAVHNCGE